MTRSIVSILFATLLLSLCAPAKADDPGYFLSWQQKKDLLRLGRIQDSAGTWYDVWICPGYTPPTCYARDHVRKAGVNFHEYIEANKYHSLKEASKACFNWAFEECGLGFTVKGIPRAWGRHFSVAHERTQRRVFGWWMAYPWAFMESTVESTFRGALGTVGTVGGTVSGVAIVPAYHALDSAVAGVWNLSVNGVIIPSVGITWNTVVSPPLALVGQKPSESRVDGFWVTIVSSGAEPGMLKLAPGEIELLGQWGLLLLKETQPFAEQRDQLGKEAGEKETQLRREIRELQLDTERQRTALREKECEAIRQAVATNASLAAVPPYAGNYEAGIRRYLAGQQLTGTEIEKILNLLRTYQCPRTFVPSQIREKTDPLRRSVDVIGESVEDTLK